MQSKQLSGFNRFSAIMFLHKSPLLQKRDKIQLRGLRVLWETLSVAQAYLFFLYHRSLNDLFSPDIHIAPKRVWKTFLKRTKTKKNNVCLHLHALFFKLNLGNFPSETSQMIQNTPGLWHCTVCFIIQVAVQNFFTGLTVMSCDRTTDIREAPHV